MLYVQQQETCYIFLSLDCAFPLHENHSCSSLSSNVSEPFIIVCTVVKCMARKIHAFKHSRMRHYIFCVVCCVLSMIMATMVYTNVCGCVLVNEARAVYMPIKFRNSYAIICAVQTVYIE